LENTICPKGGGKSDLAAATFVPKDDRSPIVISYRGTKATNDLGHDVKLAVSGTAGEKLRHSAYDFYQKVRDKYKGREIILVGHSLGGNLAQYVGIKAYNLNNENVKDPKLSVRTFNSAPVKLSHDIVLKKHRKLQRRFANYRLSNDIISNAPIISNSYGDTYHFKVDAEISDEVSDKIDSLLNNDLLRIIPKGEVKDRFVSVLTSMSERLTSHKMDSILKYILKYVQQLHIGGTTKKDAMTNRSLESFIELSIWFYQPYFLQSTFAHYEVNTQYKH
jgi:Mbeg1-like